jgi:hypothetical protein
MHPGCQLQIVFAADIRVGDGIVGMWIGGEYDECEPTNEHFLGLSRATEPYGRFVAQSEGHYPGSISDAGVGFKEYDGLHSLRGLERIDRNERFAIDGTTSGNGTVYVDV